MTDIVKIFVDGGSRNNPGPSACAFVAPERHECGSKFLGVKTNNEAEYCAVLLAIAYAKSKGLKSVHLFSDSQCVVKQLHGEFAIREPRLQLLRDAIWTAKTYFESFNLTQIKRNKNREADKLCNAELNRHV